MKYWPLIFGIPLLAGCAHFKPQPISPDESAAQLESRRLDDADLRKFLEHYSQIGITNWPAKSWNLEELTLVAFYFHPSLEVARAQWLVAEAGLRTAGARPNPSVSVSPGYDTQIPGNFSPWLVPVTFDLPIETAGKRGHREAQALRIAEAARWNVVSAAWQIRSAVRVNLLDFTMAGGRANLLQKEFSARQQIAQFLQQRLDAGEIARPVLTIARIALNRTLLDLGEARSSQANARARLAEALGLNEAALEGAELNFDFSTNDPAQFTSADARLVALRSRADVLSALAEYAASEADLQLEIAKQYPDLHLGPGYAWNTGSAGDSEWTLGLTLQLPILDQNQGPIAEAEARRKLAATKFAALQSQVIGEIDRAMVDFRLAREQLQTGNELLVSEQRLRTSAEAQVEAGAGDPLDALNAELELSSAALAQLDNEAKLQTAFGELEDALQRPADSISAVINKIAAENPNHFFQ
jgi:outer membrane protein TolC